MSLFDLQDVCIAIGSIATLDLPTVVDLIGIYGLKGPYCTLTTTKWFLLALSVIPRGSWGDVARRSYHDPLDSSSSSDSEQEEVHCFMADQTSDDEIFDFSNVEFTREDLVSALNDMVKEYRKLSHSFEEVKAKNISLKSSLIESSSDELEDIDSLKIELRKLTAENDLLRNESSELKAEVQKLTKQMSSWNQSARALHKLHEIQKSVHDRTGLGFNSSDSSE
ncbi:hypothetical protein F511_04613 [Dorcoceras hygrometricum]|uniref:Uncharacterized protein n=1 Tax=Dorcoceras hygrometricum TaxID=472368 RepID=A0A2Z7BGR6_9LAMI|nr:hypothetical protein F511_04613 [Dorcoceras hygrometricum]